MKEGQKEWSLYKLKVKVDGKSIFLCPLLIVQVLTRSDS
jgi:hypothetical protein